MAGFQSAITINEAMQSIKNNEYLLPAFQRELCLARLASRRTL
ncbi:hypothetical protein [Helicobacter sp. UBA3407]|nr:hypothetical protein [Helicobacter sp. UBA3407]